MTLSRKVSVRHRTCGTQIEVISITQEPVEM